MKLAMRLAIAAGIALAATPQAPAQTQTAPPPQGNAPAPATRVTTREFLDWAWNLDDFEVETGRAVESKVKDFDMREFALAMTRDHARLSDELTAIAGRQDLELPKALDVERQQKLQTLLSASGQGLEAEYRNQQIDAHRNAVRLFESYADKGDNAQLKQWARRSLPMLQDHLALAQRLHRPPGTM